MLDNKGYVRITDFGISKLYSSRNSNETSGTPGYMSPEVMKCQNHTAAVDFFALGVMGYEFMLGKRPYIGKSRKEIKEQMLSRQASIKLCSIPDGWSEESADFINKLLMRKPEERLGFRGVQELKEHPWLKYFPWSELLAKSIEAPFVPERKDNFDKRYCEAPDKIGMETRMRYAGYKHDRNFEHMFYNFTFYNIDNENNSNLNSNMNTIRHGSTIVINSSMSTISQNTNRAPITYKKFTKSPRALSACSSTKKFSTIKNKSRSSGNLLELEMSSTYVKNAINNNNTSKKRDIVMNKNLSVLSRSHNTIKRTSTPINKGFTYSISSVKGAKTPNRNINILKSKVSGSYMKQKGFNSSSSFSSLTVAKQKTISNSKTKVMKRSKSSYGEFLSKHSKSNLNIKTANTPSNTIRAKSRVVTPIMRTTNHNINRCAINRTNTTKKEVVNIVVSNIGNIFPANNKNGKRLLPSNSVNYLFKNYRMSNHSTNSTGSSSQSTHKFFGK